MWLQLVFLCLSAAEVDGRQAGASEAPRAQVAPEALSEANAMICGSRCVWYLSRYYGGDEELIEVVREMQWPDVDEPVSMETVAKALRRRKIHSAAIRFNPEKATINSEYPSILHLCAGESGFGHYVVLLPSSTGTDMVIWDGLNGKRKMPYSEFAARASGAAILTALSPIREPKKALTPVFHTSTSCQLILVSVGVCVLAVFCCVWLRLRRENAVTTVVS